MFFKYLTIAYDIIYKYYNIVIYIVSKDSIYKLLEYYMTIYKFK